MPVRGVGSRSDGVGDGGRRSRLPARTAKLACALAILTSATFAGAATIDFGEMHPWNDPTSTTETYVFPSGTVVVTITDPSSALQTTAGAPGPSPTTNDYLNPPDNAANNPNPQSLFLYTDGNGRGAGAVRVTIEFLFAAGVTDIQFDLFDVDRGAGQWRDRIRLRSIDFFTAASELPTTVSSIGAATPVWVYNATNGAVRGTGDSGGPGNASDAGTARIEFMGGTYTQIELIYANTDDAAGIQWISLSDIAFSILPTPEPSPALLIVGGLLVLAHNSRRTQRAALAAGGTRARVPNHRAG